jgi:hypothetical protein
MGRWQANINIPYLKPKSSEGELSGYVRGSINVYAKVGNCNCRGGKPKSTNRCKTVGGASGHIEITATFVDIKVGDGSNGVDVRSLFCMDLHDLGPPQLEQIA